MLKKSAKKSGMNVIDGDVNFSRVDDSAKKQVGNYTTTIETDATDQENKSAQLLKQFSAES